MFDLKKSYDYNRDTAENGAKMFVGNDKEEFVLICRLPNPNYSAELTSTMQRNGKVLEFLKTQDSKKFEEKDRDLQAEVLAKTIVVGWGKKFGTEGKALPYSVKTCADILKQYPDFRSDCVTFAADIANYPAEMDVAEVKKS